jgi:uncharacterized protein (DUF885 family)
MAPPSVTEISDRYVERYAALDPVVATAEGIPGYDAELTDYSPDGIAERLAHSRHALRELERVDPATDDERTARDVLARHLETNIELTDAGEELRPLRVIGSPVSDVRMCFDLMPRATEEHWQTIAARIAGVPEALDGLRVTLQQGVETGLVAAKRQAAACARQADVWGGHDHGTKPYFLRLVDDYDAAGVDHGALRARLEDVAGRATEAYASLGRFLVEEYLPHASDRDAVGLERYTRWARVFTGTRLDLQETYEWGWSELARLEHAMGSVAERILPGEALPAVIRHLDHDPTRMIEGAEPFRRWLQELLDRSIRELNGVHFDIPEPLTRVEAMIAPPGGAAAMYYTGPSEDFTRPGRTWYPTQGRTTFPLWGEVSTCYHEGVPGHHLQVATTRYLADRLNRFRRTLAWNSGHGEGWALYAERLMGELGYLEDPAYELGMLRAQAMRAVRVVIDIGLHLELAIPASGHYHPGEQWTAELATPFLAERSHYEDDFVTSEIERYLGWPGQAISYKVGERVWIECREAARARHGADFDLKAFHTRALELGPMGLDQLREELARI